jgi:hypothetical protein
MGLGDGGKPEGVWQALLVRLPSSCEREHGSRSTTRTEARGRSSQRKTSSPSPAFHHLCACPGSTRRPRTSQSEPGGRALLRRTPAAPGTLGAKVAGKRIEARAGDVLVVKLDSYVLAVGLRRGLEKCHPLVRDGVDEGLALADHCCLLMWFVTSGRSRRHGPMKGARAQGATWSQVAEALHRTRQAVEQRFG